MMNTKASPRIFRKTVNSLLTLALTVAFCHCVPAARSSDLAIVKESDLSGSYGSQDAYYFEVLSDVETLQLSGAITGYGNVDLIVAQASDTDYSNIPEQYVGQNGKIVIPNLPRGSYKAVVFGKTDYAGFSFELAITAIGVVQLDVPDLKQYSAPWGKFAYGLGVATKDGGLATISAKGCALTAVNMALDYAGIDSPDGIPYDPLTLNGLLVDEGGYTPASDIDWPKAVEIASGGQANWLDLPAYDSKTTPDQTAGLLTSVLDAGFPVIVRVPSPHGSGHYVVVTGYSGNDFFINDPGSGKITFLSSYSSYQLRGFVMRTDPFRSFQDAPSKLLGKTAKDATVTGNPMGMYFAVDDTVDLKVTDPSGNIAEVYPDGTVRQDIPNCSVFTDDLEDDLNGTPPAKSTHFIYVKWPATGSYKVSVTGVKTGSYQGSVYLLDTNGNATTSDLSGSIKSGSVASRTVKLTTTAPVSVTAAVTQPDADEASLQKGVIVVTRTGALSSGLTVVYAVKGSAVNGRDYKELNGAVTIPSGHASAKIKVKPLGVAFDGTRKVKIVLQSAAGYSVGSSKKAKITLLGQ